MLQQIYKWLCRLAGVREDAILRAPNAMVIPATFGLVLFVATLISALTMGYALLRVFYGEPYAGVIATMGGLLWWPLVFGVDRLMINGATSGPIWACVLKVAVRVAVATLVGISISTPVFLKFERNNIDLALYQANRAAISKEAEENAHLAGLPDAQSTYAQAASEARKAEDVLATGPGSSAEYTAAVRERDTAEDTERSIEAHNLIAIANTEARLKTLPPESPTSITELARIQQLRAQVSQARQDVARANGDVVRAESVWRSTANQRLQETRTDAAEARKEFRTAADKTEHADAVSTDEINRLSTPNLATEWATAEKIMSDPRNPQAAAMRNAALGIHSLFVLIELLIVTIKLTMPESAMDRVLTTCEEEERERNTLQANARILRMQASAEAAIDVYQQAVQRWHDERRLQVQHHGAMSTPDLQALTDECAGAITAAF
jgi:hypothetical protein